MRIAIGSDHAGYDLKNHLGRRLTSQGVEVNDAGPHELDPADDYPDFAHAVARAVQSRESDLGIVVCSTGAGSCMAANKVRGVRAALCHDAFCARMSREHNDANVLCLGANIVGMALAEEITDAWVAGSFSGEERHRRRVDKLAGIEASEAD
jgi:ribose 5-phosphate isomerase B